MSLLTMKNYIEPSKDRWRFGVSTPTQYALGFSRFCVSKLALGSDFCEYSSGMDPCRVDTYSVKLASFAVPDITLNVSAAFDTVDHGILLERLRISFGVTGAFLCWLESF